MPGLYQRDNLAQQLAQAIEMAQRRREHTRAIEAQRNSENVKAATDFAKALGRTYETWDSKDDEDKLAALQKEREEAIAQQEYEQSVRDKYNEQVAQRNAVGDYLFQQGLRAGANPYLRELNSTNAMAGYVPMSKYTDAMDGYVPTEGIYTARPSYNDIIKRRGLL